MNASLFQNLLAKEFDKLPAQIQTLHFPYERRVWRGRANVIRGKGWLSRICGWVARLPPNMHDVTVQVTIMQNAEGETWGRLFDQHAMPSQLKQQGDYLHEALGPLRFLFCLTAEDTAIYWQVHKVSFWKIPLPNFLFQKVYARETEESGKYHFHVHAELPLIGLLVEYQGWLE